MTQAVGKSDMHVRRIDDATSVVEIRGEITAGSEKPLMDAYAEACGAKTRAVILDFGRLDYMNSGGIGLLVTLLVRANRQKQRLAAFGLNEHYRQIFELTRLDEAIGIFTDEGSAVAGGKA
jgi:anti-sigma B factor antagonist